MNSHAIVYVPTKIGEGFFTDFQPPASGITDDGKVWSWNNLAGKFIPTALGTSATLNVGTSANNVVQLDGSSRLPAVDGSQLTGVVAAASPGGSTTQVQYNNDGAFAGHSGMTYNATDSRLTVAGGLVAPSMRPASDSTTALQWQNAAGTAIVTVDTKNGRVGFGVTPTGYPVSIKSNTGGSALNIVGRSNHYGDLIFTKSDGTTVLGGLSGSFGASGRVSLMDSGYNEILTISGQRVGVNQISPNFPLEVVTNTGTVALFRSSSAIGYGGFRMYNDQNNLFRALEIDYSGSSYPSALLTGGPSGEAGAIYTTGTYPLMLGTALNVVLLLQANGYVALGQASATALLDLAASTTARASLRVRAGTAPTTPNDGDSWYDGTDYYLRSTANYSVGQVVRTTAIRPVADSTSALQWQNAAGTAVVTVDTTNRRLDLASTQTLSATNYLQTWVNNSVTRSRIDSRGAQYWYLSNIVAEVGSIEYGTPGGLPGIIFHNGASYNLNRFNFFYDTATSVALNFDADYISPYYGGLKISAGGGVECNVIGSNTTIITNALTLRYVSSETPAPGHGIGVIAALKSSTTQNNSIGRLTWEWNRDDANSAVHGTRSARMRLTGNYTSTERVFIDAIAGSSAPLIGFLGATPVVRQVVPTGSSIDTVITALQNLGLFSQT